MLDFDQWNPGFISSETCMSDQCRSQEGSRAEIASEKVLLYSIARLSPCSTLAGTFASNALTGLHVTWCSLIIKYYCVSKQFLQFMHLNITSGTFSSTGLVPILADSCGLYYDHHCYCYCCCCCCCDFATTSVFCFTQPTFLKLLVL